MEPFENISTDKNCAYKSFWADAIALLQKLVHLLTIEKEIKNYFNIWEIVSIKSFGSKGLAIAVVPPSC